MNLNLSQIKNELSQVWQELPNTKEKISSVIVPVFESDTLGQGLILTQRSKHLKSHPGQISFPGGVVDPEDSDLLQCALREWEEEMGVTRDHIEVLGKHTGLQTRTGFHITPFLGKYTGDFIFSHNKDEVEKIIILPLNELIHAPFYKINIPNQKILNTAYYFDLKEGLLWGATCEIILSFLKDYASFERIPQIVKPNLNFPPFLNPKLL
ncbi:MAG: CoA pyrophosphatase [Leptospira sp.]|nr:CoA pyrophosphatase [Leptospira sp.]